MSAPRPARIRGRTHRLILSRYPTVGVFDDIAASEADLRAAFELESLTSGRLTEAARLARLPGGALLTGPGATLVMAAFLYADPAGGRFTDHRLGAWYAAREIETAIEETVFHNDRRLRASAGGFPARLQLRDLITDVDFAALDLRGREDLHDPATHAPSQAFAAGRRWPFAEPPHDAFVYDSVRRKGGTNLVIFRPAAVPLPVLQGEHYEYVWDARGALDVLKLTGVAR